MRTAKLDSGMNWTGNGLRELEQLFRSQRLEYECLSWKSGAAMIVHWHAICS